jgi:hypothetical protein
LPGISARQEARSSAPSKVIATLLYADAACRRCRMGKAVRTYVYRRWLTKESRTSCEHVTLLSQARGGCVTCAWTSFTRHRPSRSTGAHHVPT